MKIGIIGCGMVGKTLMEGFIRKEFSVSGYDKYKPEYTNNYDLVLESDVIFLCLPTMPKKDGKMDLTPFNEVLKDLKNEEFKGLIIIKSTILPGTTASFYKEYGLNIVHSPEFLSEATALYDLLNPDRIVLGVPDKAIDTSDFYRIHSIFDTEIIETDSTTSEFAKFMQNTFFATKVTFANEMARTAKEIGADYNRAKEILYKDKEIGKNHLTIYGKGGYGGNCVKGESAIFHNCLSKDTLQFISFIKEKFNPKLLSTVQQINLEVKMAGKNEI